MYVEDERILLCRVEIGRLYDPALNLLAADRVVPNLFDLAELAPFKHIVVDVCDAPQHRLFDVEDHDIIRRLRRGEQTSRDAVAAERREVELLIALRQLHGRTALD